MQRLEFPNLTPKGKFISEFVFLTAPSLFWDSSSLRGARRQSLSIIFYKEAIFLQHGLSLDCFLKDEQKRALLLFTS